MSVAADPVLALAREVRRAAVAPGAARVVVLDLDGTLAPIAPQPSAARVSPATRGALARLVGERWTVAVVSGRSRADALRLVGVRGVHVFGCHGIEGVWRGRRRPGLPADTRRRLAAAARAAERLAGRFPGALAERKPAGVVLHDRRVPRERLAAWRRAVRDALAEWDLTGLEVVPGKRSIEVRPAGRGKSEVVHLLLGRRPRRFDASIVAVGDDVTDEDLFGAVRGRGLGVRVGRLPAGTAAARRLPSPRAVSRFLGALAASRADAPRGGRGAR